MGIPNQNYNTPYMQYQPSQSIDMLLNKFQMDQEERKRLKNIRYLFPSLIVQGYHHYLYGPAGAGKTTVILHLAIEICRRNPDIVIYFFYLDGSQNMAAEATEYIESLHLQNNIKILTKGSSQEYVNILNQAVSTKLNLQGSLFIYDTFKFITSDINSKNANKSAMHFIKQLLKLGGTFISLGHTNKDSKKQSGTAEIEQDSDALLRIDSTQDHTGYQTATISQAGRCRMSVKDVSFSFQPGDITSVTQLNEVVNITELEENKEISNNNIPIIESLQELIAAKAMNQQQILQQTKDHPFLKKFAINTIRDVLNKYIDKHWKCTSGQNNAKIYIPLESTYTQLSLMDEWNNLHTKVNNPNKNQNCPVISDKAV